MLLWNLLGERPVDVLAWESFGNDWVKDIVDQLKIENTRVLKAEYGKIIDNNYSDYSFVLEIEVLYEKCNSFFEQQPIIDHFSPQHLSATSSRTHCCHLPPRPLRRFAIRHDQRSPYQEEGTCSHSRHSRR